MDQKQQLISVWTKGLEGNAESQLHAAGLLGEAIDPKALNNPIPDFEEAGGSKKSKRTWWLLGFAVASVISTLVVAGVWGRHYAILKYSVSSVRLFPVSTLPKISTSSPQAELVLNGDPNRSGKAAQMRALWESDPKNPAFYADYSREYLHEHGRLPNDFLKVAANIDPENGWFPYLAACVTAEGAAKKNNLLAEHPRSPIKSKNIRKESYDDRQKLRRRIVKPYEILDPLKVENALRLWRQSLRMPKFTSYADEMHQLRYPYLNEADNLLEWIHVVIYQACQPTPTHQRNLDTIFAAELQREDLSAQDCEKLLLDIERYFKRIYSEPPSNVVKELLSKYSLKSSHEQVQVIKPAGVDDQLLQRFRKRLAALQNYSDDLRARNILLEKNKTLPKNASYFTQLRVLPLQFQCLTSLALSEEDLKPTNQVEHLFLMQIMAFLAMLFLLLFLPYILLFRRHTPIHGLAQQAWLAMPIRDNVKLACWSVLLPLVYFTLLYLLTPLAGKDLAASWLNPAIPVGSLILMMFALPRLLVHQYTSFWENLAFRKSSRSLSLAWAFVILALVPMHAFSLIHQSIENIVVLYMVLISCFIPLISWLLWSGCRGCFSRNHYMRVMHSLRRRMLAFSTISAVLLLFLCGFVLRFGESRAIKMDRTLTIPANVASPTIYESEIAKVAQAEIKNLLDSSLISK